ncbi:MAG: 2-hydroxyacyl-CoA dehydratase [Bacilli bacterium]|nr:2-hydroxyacyl-CoA dehydratase [Bacilli bacterium]MDD4282249.1 2-hydroxyacyl-CoA dehydratase [Bacilli bacterium]
MLEQKPEKIVAFPQMGNYDVPAKYLLSNILNIKIIDIPKITNKTIELGVRYSPEFVCTPFKYTIGTLIEALDMGANVLVQAGGGCRYGYYSELQEQILKDLGYDFIFINLMSKGKKSLKKIINELKIIDSNFNIIKSLYYLTITIKMVKYMDRVDDYIRENIGFEVEENSFIRLNEEMLNSFKTVKTNVGLYLKYKYYFKKIKKIKVKKPLNHLKIGLIGELYTLMEPFSNYELERELASYRMSIKRYTNVYYLLFQKKRKSKKYVRYANEYIKYKMGADAADNIGRTKYLCKHNYDGIIHIKSTFCTPEIGAMPIINKICQEYKTPLLFFSFDSNTSEVGIKTRIEAFYDMIEGKSK